MRKTNLGFLGTPPWSSVNSEKSREGVVTTPPSVDVLQKNGSQGLKQVTHPEVKVSILGDGISFYLWFMMEVKILGSAAIHRSPSQTLVVGSIFPGDHDGGLHYGVQAHLQGSVSLGIMMELNTKILGTCVAFVLIVAYCQKFKGYWTSIIQYNIYLFVSSSRER